MMVDQPKYKTTDEVDFVIIGSGAAGGILAKELSTNGFRVVVLEQGPYLTESDFTHNEIEILAQDKLTNHPKLQPNTFRKTPDDKAKPQRVVMYGRCVGGTSVHFTANFWRFHEIDFIERGKVGAIPGANLVDWPIRYADLEPYYTKVEWEIGVSGLAGASPFDPPRSKPYPMPPLPVKSSGVIFERAARQLGWNPFPAPMAILSQPRAGRSACMNCGFCLSFGCEVGAKSSSLVAAIRVAERTGRCDRVRQRRGDAATVADVGQCAISEWACEFERHGGQEPDAEQQRDFAGGIRASAERLQRFRGEPHSPRFL
jgi:choline dehydrogenase-like flavoprotein